MRRNLSVEDIMGSLTKMNSAGGGFPRTDSEQAFQVRPRLEPCQVIHWSQIHAALQRRCKTSARPNRAGWRHIAPAASVVTVSDVCVPRHAGIPEAHPVVK